MTRPLVSLELRRFRAFERFTVTFGPTAVLVGPNNAGKSTVVSALRSVAYMVRTAKRIRPTGRGFRGERRVLKYELVTSQVGLSEDSLRWESQDAEVSIRATFANRSRLYAIWPAEDVGDPYFFVQGPDGHAYRDIPEIREKLPVVGVLPNLSPVEQREDLLDADYIRSNLGSRRSSLHFRNQLLLLARGDLPGLDWDGWTAFLRTWLPEIQLRPPESSEGGVDVYYREEPRPSWKELVWAGDGFQVYMQNLFHLYRLRGSDVIVLDEPDVYLHADLQRRLTQVAGNSNAQVVVATHSTEVIAEAGTSAIVWMDRTRSRAYRAPDDESLDALAGQLGSQFNLRLAKVLRARHTLFVEGADAGFLKDIARLIGATAFANEVYLAIVPIEGWSNQFRPEAFGWVNDKLLKGSMSATLLLDRDYHADPHVEQIKQHFEKAKLGCHVWLRKEIESYFLHAGAMARAGTASEELMTQILATTTERMYEDVLFQFVAAAKQDQPENRHVADSTIAKRFIPWLRKLWTDPTQRLYRCPAKEVLSAVNQELAASGHKTLTFSAIIRRLRPQEVPDEMSNIIRSINRRLMRTP